MKLISLFFLFHNIFMSGFCQIITSKIPDSIKAAGFYAEIKITESSKSKKSGGGITANVSSVILGYEKDQKIVQFRFFDKPRPDVAFGNNVYKYGPGNAWNYDWKYTETYPLLILTANDSASHKTIYSGYIFLPEEKKWKLIATRSYSNTINVNYVSTRNRKNAAVTFGNRWLLLSNGTWKALDSQTTKSPVLRPFSNIDSIPQQKIEEDVLIAKLPKGSVTYKDGIFYQQIREGNGRLVQVTDTVIIHYKGWLFSNGSVFDETKEKPATFPLNRLIRGWQVGVPQCRVGGKIRLYIPSGSAYGIRTFATDIPPNSTLVFDVEVLDAKEKLIK